MLVRQSFDHNKFQVENGGGSAWNSAVESELREDLDRLKPEEAAVLAMLRGRLARELSRDVPPNSQPKTRQVVHAA